MYIRTGRHIINLDKIKFIRLSIHGKISDIELAFVLKEGGFEDAAINVPYPSIDAAQAALDIIAEAMVNNASFLDIRATQIPKE